MSWGIRRIIRGQMIKSKLNNASEMTHSNCHDNTVKEYSQGSLFPEVSRQY